jgi:hypothetical protein
MVIMDIDKATKIFQENYKQWLGDPNRNKNGYEYERSFVEQMQKMEKELFQDSIGEIPSNKNVKKKSKPALGK